MTYPKGHKFEGEWNNGEQHGRGTFTWPDGRKYTGMFKNGNPYGQGTYTYLDGTKNFGKWEVTQENFLWKTNIDDDAQPKEISTLYHWETSSGMEWVTIGADDIHPKYEGETKNEEPNGIGTLTYPKGHKFEGEWNDGEQHGRGTLPGLMEGSIQVSSRTVNHMGKEYTLIKMELRTWVSGKLLKRTFYGRQRLILLRELIKKY